jgi:hypothetical protein
MFTRGLRVRAGGCAQRVWRMVAEVSEKMLLRAGTPRDACCDAHADKLPALPGQLCTRQQLSASVESRQALKQTSRIRAMLTSSGQLSALETLGLCGVWQPRSRSTRKRGGIAAEKPVDRSRPRNIASREPMMAR